MNRNSLFFAVVFVCGCSGSAFTFAEDDAGDETPDAIAPAADTGTSPDAGDGGEVLEDASADAHETHDAGDEAADAIATDAASSPDTSPTPLCCFITSTYGAPCESPTSWTCGGQTLCGSSSCATGDPCVTSNDANGAVAPCL